MPASDGFLERLGLARLRDQKTQLVIASGLAAAVVIAAAVALPNSKESAKTVGSPSERAAEALRENIAEKIAEENSGGGAGPLGGASGRSTGSISDVSDAATKKLPPITATTVKVGITYVSDAGKTNEQAGFGSIGQLDQRRAWDALLKKINADPPQGRKVIPVFYSQTENELISKGAERVEQEACVKFTKDNPVFLVFDGTLIGAADVFHQCATKARIPEIGSAINDIRQDFARFPYFVAPNDSAFDRMAEYEVDQLYAAGFFSKFKENESTYEPHKPIDGKAKIGLIRYDTAGHNVAAGAMKQRLAAHGLGLCTNCEWKIAYSADNPQEMLDDSAEVNAAILDAKSKNVTHMLFLGSIAGVRITLFFVDGAEKQHYRPRLGLNPQDAPTAVRDFYESNSQGASAANESYPQFRDSVLITDGPAGLDQTTAAFNACKKLLMDAGETFNGSEASNKEGQMGAYCDPVVYYIAVMNATGRALTVDSWMNGVANMAPAPSVGVFAMQTKANRHDGSGAIKRALWNEDCHCYKAISGIVPV